MPFAQEELSQLARLPVDVFEEVESTNDEAFRLAKSQSSGVVVTERQTKGRGRRGAEWFCSEGDGLAFSIYGTPPWNPVLWPRLALVAGLAVVRAVERLGISAEIKWPNDVLIGGKKVCGILVEAENGVLVVGVGLNVKGRDFPESIRAVATSLEMASGQILAREEVLLAIVKEWSGLVDGGERRFAEILRMIRERCALTGEEICWSQQGQTFRGSCLGIGQAGELLVKTSQGQERLISVDQVRVVS